MESSTQTSSTSPPNPERLIRRVDAHHHLWRYSPDEFPWISEEMATLRQDFLIKDLRVSLREANVDATVAVQARETLAETRWLLSFSKSTSPIQGVVGWAPLEHEELPDILGALGDTGKLVGLREIIQGQPDGFLDRERFNLGIGELRNFNLAYDILIQERQLEEAIRFVDRHPSQQFVLDHAAKPRIATGEMNRWETNLRELARRSNVVCKVSGLATEARWDDWNLETLRPYLDVCVGSFGPARLLAGSDWPVCLVATGYCQWWNVLAEYFQHFSNDEIARIFGRNALDVYRLPRTVEVRS